MVSEEYYPYIQNLFKRWAPLYNLMEPFISQIRYHVVDIVKAPSGSLILDVATGTGRQAAAFGKQGHTVIGIDLSPDMLRIAKKTISSSQVTFLNADATHIPFDNDFFDLCCISLALHDMPPEVRAKVLQEMIRVTKPKGRIVIIDYALPEASVKKFLIFHFIKLYESKYYPGFIQSDVPKILQDAGLKIHSDHRVTFGAVRVIQAIK